MPKRITIIFLLICLSFSYVFSQKDQEKKNLKGNIKTESYRSYDAVQDSQGIVRKDLTLETTTFYDKKGNAKEYLVLSENDTLVYTYEYNDHYNKVKHMNRRGEGVHEQTTYYYNEEGQLDSTKCVDLLSNELVFFKTYTLDEEGNLKETRKTDDKVSIKYNEAGNIVEYTMPAGKVEVKYDSLGRESEEIMYDSDGMLLSRSFYDYENGRLKEIRDEDHEGVVEMKTTYTYSNFDHEGNWLRKEVYYDGEVSSVVKREFEYYK